MSQTGTPTEFLQLGITEPDDTLNVLVDLNGQWQKIDTGVKNVDTKANTNASGISALNTAVQDNTENITNILETNVNQQNSIDTLQSKVATLEQDDTDYGTRITAVEAGVQENSELINDLEVDLSGVKTSVGTVPEGSNLQGEVNGLDTRVTALENSGSVAAVEARVTTLETEVGTVPSGETVQGQITTLNGQVNSGNIPFRFSVDGGGNYGYLKADDSFVPFSSGSSRWHELDKTAYSYNTSGSTGMYSVYDGCYSFILPRLRSTDSSSTDYKKMHDFIHDVDYTAPFTTDINTHICTIGCLLFARIPLTSSNPPLYLIKNGTITQINRTLVGAIYDRDTNYTHYLTKIDNAYQYKVVDVDGNDVGQTVNFTLRGASTVPMYFTTTRLIYRYSGTSYWVEFDTTTGTSVETTYTNGIFLKVEYQLDQRCYHISHAYEISYGSGNSSAPTASVAVFSPCPKGTFLTQIGSNYYYYL